MDNIINNFILSEEIADYDKTNKPQQLSVYELLPVAISWNYQGKKYAIQNGNKLTAKLLNDKKHIAIIETSKNKKLNEAYIVDGHNIQKYNIRKLVNKTNLEIKAPYSAGENDYIKLDKNSLFFYDVYYVGPELYFYVIIQNEDYRFSFALETGEIGKLIISK
jgi:hypothetical protein